MKTLIIYDSVYGNTATLAQAAALALEGEKIVRMVSEARTDNLADIDCLIIATPTHAGRASATIQAFIRSLPEGALVNKRAAVFSTGIKAQGKNIALRLLLKILGYAATPTLTLLLKKGALIAGEPLDLMVKGKQGPLLEGELEKVITWAKNLK